jgi:hypothetical protein
MAGQTIAMAAKIIYEYCIPISFIVNYLPKLFKNFLEDIHLLYEDCLDQEEIDSLSFSISNEE